MYLTNLKGFLLILWCLQAVGASAQILEPAKWSHSASTKEYKLGDELDLIFKVKIDQDWYLYSTDFDPDLGPLVTTFEFEPNSSYELIGDIQPIGSKRKYDTLWEGEYTYFKKEGEFRQGIKVTQKDLKVKGFYAYQVCSDIDGKCIPFDDEFVFADFKLIAGTNMDADAEPPVKSTAEETKGEAPTQSLLSQRHSKDPYSLGGFMIVAFLAGLAALLTPCVFPMIPMTVTFFTTDQGAENGKAKAILYGVSIVGIYTLTGTLVSVLVGPEFANWLATHWLPNILFFAIFIFFALSFLGMFEITLPSSLVNNVDRQADRGGYVGVFFMAFTLVLVSFSCTGPIVGSILVESARGQVLKPVLGMLAFSSAFAIPFSLFAFFPEWLKKLPKSGGWLNSVKVVLGFLELALALKFLSIADQVYHWGILDRDVFLVIWIIIMLMMGFYILGKIRLPGDSKMEALSVPRLLLALVTFSFVLYLIPGLFGAPLKALAGYLPPLTTHDFNIVSLLRENDRLDPSEKTLCDEPKYAYMLHMPHEIQGYFDYQQALDCAREQNKPLFIDFTGHGCVNCREMEARVWSEKEVLSRLKADFVVVALYVDEKTELPESQWYTSTYDGKVKKTIGKQNADLQITRYENNAQPFYVILDNQEQLLETPKAYDLNVQNFVQFLDAAKEKYYADKIASR